MEEINPENKEGIPVKFTLDLIPELKNKN